MTRVQTQWPVFHVCGHRQEHDLTKITPKDRESRARWLATRVCTKCWKSLTPEPTAGSGPAPACADTWTQVRPLPSLEGAPKQVIWATSLKVTLLTRLSDVPHFLGAKYAPTSDSGRRGVDDGRNVQEFQHLLA